MVSLITREPRIKQIGAFSDMVAVDDGMCLGARCTGAVCISSLFGGEPGTHSVSKTRGRHSLAEQSKLSWVNGRSFNVQLAYLGSGARLRSTVTPTICTCTSIPLL